MEPEYEPETYPQDEEGEEEIPSLEEEKETILKSITGWKLLLIIIVAFVLFLMFKFAPQVSKTKEFVETQVGGDIGSEAKFVSSCQASEWYRKGCKGHPSEDVIKSAEENLGTTDEETLRTLCQCWT